MKSIRKVTRKYIVGGNEKMDEQKKIIVWNRIQLERKMFLNRCIMVFSHFGAAENFHITGLNMHPGNYQ